MRNDTITSVERFSPPIPPPPLPVDPSDARSVALLTGGVAHVLNNALQSMIGHAELIAGGVLNAAELRASARTIRKTGLRASHVLERLTDLARKQIDPSLLDLSTELLDAVPALRSLLPVGIELATATADRLCPIWIDRRNLVLLLRNLVENAREAMPRGGHISIAVRVEDGPRPASGHPGSKAVLEVTDTGTGLDPEVRAHLFEPFFTTRPGAAGLGLACVHEIVRERGGEITVGSELGRGSRFLIEFPLAEVDESTRPLIASGARPALTAEASPTIPLIQTHVKTPEPVGHGETVLVAEDDPNISDIMEMQLSGLGYVVRTAASAEEALSVLEAPDTRCDLLLTDLMMPGISGLELAERLRVSRPELPVVFMTGYLTEAVEKKLSRQPRTSYLAKPFQLALLARHIDALLHGGANQPVVAAGPPDR